MGVQNKLIAQGRGPALPVPSLAEIAAHQTIHYLETNKLPLDAIPGAKELAQKVGFTQRWQMFAPSPPTLDGFPVFETISENGAVEDIFTSPPRALSFETPDDVVGLFDSARQRAFLLQAWLMEDQDRATFFTRYARLRCAEVNADRAAGARITALRLHYIQNKTKSNYQEEVTRHDLGRVDCAADG